MLQKSIVRLEQRHVLVDVRSAMPRDTASSKVAARAANRMRSTRTVPPLAIHADRSHDPTLRQLAHELNSLLDGSLRCVGMARTMLEGEVDANHDAAIDGLSNAHAAMRHMAALIERALKRTSEPEELHPTFVSSQSIGELCQELDGLLAPQAAQADSQVHWDIEQSCQKQFAGPLGVVILNGVRNAIQACEFVGGRQLRRVEVNIRMRDARLEVSIAGPASSRPIRHGVGLALSHQIVAELEGELALNREADQSLLRLSVPTANLNRHG